MGCVFKPKTDRVRVSSEVMQNAVKRVLEGSSERETAKEFKIPRTSLQRQVHKARQVGETSYTFEPNVGNRRIFSLEEEKHLCDYLKTASKMCYGLSTTQTRELAYQYAKLLNKGIPETWEKNKSAGVDWIRGFMGRNPELSLRRPEATSLSRATSFNEFNVKMFFDNLNAVLLDNSFSPHEIFNCDETGLMTVTKPPKVIAPTGVKQVGQVTSGERGSLVTMLNFISGDGNTVPPVFIFPRVIFKDYMLNDAPPGSLGLAYETGWMTEDNFLKALHHFVKFVKCTKEKKVLLLMDNHETHVNLNVINYARENGIVILTFPPHCSHRLQPLDVSVYGPFKTYMRNAQNNFMTSNAGKPITIYDLSSLAAQAFNKAFTKANILSGLKKTGISPFNNEIFDECDFLSSYVTDRPDPTVPVTPEAATNVGMQTSSLCLVTPGTSSVPVAPEASHVPVTPEAVRPYPKAGPRENKASSRKTRSRILTDSPERKFIEAKTTARLQKKSQKSLLKRTYNQKNIVDSSSDEDEKFSLHDESEDEGCEIDEEEIMPLLLDDVNVNDFVLVKFVTKKTILHYVGVIELQLEDKTEFSIKFLRKKENSYKFFFPDAPDVSVVDFEDIIRKLPQPQIIGGTSRAVATKKDITSI